MAETDRAAVAHRVCLRPELSLEEITPRLCILHCGALRGQSGGRWIFLSVEILAAGEHLQ